MTQTLKIVSAAGGGLKSDTLSAEILSFGCVGINVEDRFGSVAYAHLSPMDAQRLRDWMTEVLEDAPPAILTELVSVLRLYAYRGEYPGRPTAQETDVKARVLIAKIER